MMINTTYSSVHTACVSIRPSMKLAPAANTINSPALVYEARYIDLAALKKIPLFLILVSTSRSLAIVSHCIHGTTRYIVDPGTDIPSTRLL